MDLKINVTKKEEGVHVISLTGSLDTSTYTECEKKITPILESKPKAIIFDMAGLDYISSIGFGLIFRTKQNVEKSGGTLAITNLKPNVKRVFDTVKVIPESLFASMEAVDEYLDEFIAGISAKDEDKKDETPPPDKDAK